VTGLSVQEGALVGTATTPTSIVAVERTTGFDNQDQLYAVEVRARVSAGANLGVATRQSPTVNLDAEAGQVLTTPWTLTTPILPGERTQTYTITLPYAVTGARVRHVLVRPSDVASARFAIESVRLIFRKEHLAEVPSGVSWQGLGEVFHETLAARAPETLRFETRLPSRPVLDVALGTPEDAPVTFRLLVGRGAAKPVPVLEHTVTTPHRWERRRVDLSAFGGAQVQLSLALGAEPGTIGLWGSPALRQLQPPGRDRKPRGVILIQGDTLRIDHLDAYGYERPTAPFLKRLASEGVLFKNALAQTAWTKASTTSVMTSLYPTTHGVHQIPDRIPASTPTLAQRFRDAGYATLSLSSVSFTGRLTNLHKGFEELREAGSQPGRTLYTSKTARDYVDHLAEWLEAHRDVPFFVYLHVFDPHSPYEPRPPWSTMWADPAQRERHLRNEETLKKFIASAFLAQRGMATRDELKAAGIDPEEYLRYCKDWYDGSIRGMDAELARLMERLRGLGAADSTLVAFFADHGEEFHDHGRMWHGQGVYGEMLRVPLLFWGSGVAKGRVREETVQLIDVMPTLLELGGLEAPPGLQGQSLAPLLSEGRHAAWQPRPAIAEKHPMGGADHPNASVSYAIVDGDWKLVHNVERPPARAEFELFRFLEDPLDQKDVAGANPEVVERLRKGLEGWRRGATEAKLKPDAEATKGMSAEQLEKLRSLGYVQ
jgi:arylsulfatase A-like enzyme